jgi:hypothetical protein
MSTNVTSYGDTDTGSSPLSSTTTEMMINNNHSQILSQPSKDKSSMLRSLASKALSSISGLTSFEFQNEIDKTLPRQEGEPSGHQHHHAKNQKSLITIGSKAVMATAGPN